MIISSLDESTKEATLVDSSFCRTDVSDLLDSAFSLVERIARMFIGKQFIAVLHPSKRPGGLTTLHDGCRLIVREEDVRSHYPQPLQEWLLEAVQHLGNNIWLAKLVERKDERSIGKQCHIGRRTDIKTRLLAESLPDTFTVTFDGRDDKSIYMSRDDVPIRPSPFGPKLKQGTAYQVCPVATGRRGIYVMPNGIVNPLEKRAINESACASIGQTISVHFNAGDRRGIYALWNNYIVRPDRTWDPKPKMNSRYDVRIINLIDGFDKILFVLES